MKIPGFKSLLIAVLLVVCCTTCTGCLRSVKMAPAFRAQALDGGVVEFNPQALQKPVVLVFWASWCGPCREKVPALKALYEAKKDSVDILAVSVDQDARDAMGFVMQNEINYKVVLDRNDIARQYGVWGIPRIFIVDKTGMIRFSGSSLSGRFAATLADVSR